MDKYPITCVATFVINEKNQLLIGWRPQDQIWSLPGGKIDWQEKVKNAIARELYEETNLRLKTYRLLATNDDINDDSHCVTLLYQASVVDPGALKVTEPDKLCDFKWVDLVSVPPLFCKADQHLWSINRVNLLETKDKCP